jgi:glutamate dehydrogenase
MRNTWSDIEALDNKVDAATQYAMMHETTRLLRFGTYWLIHHQAAGLNIDQQVLRLRRGLSELDDAIPRVLSGSDLTAFESRCALYGSSKVPEALSNRMATLAALRSGLDLVAIAEQTKLPIDKAAHVYFSVGTALSLDWLREQIEILSVDGHWQAVARTTLRDNIYELQRILCQQVLRNVRRAELQHALDSWISRHEQAIASVRQTVTDMRSLPDVDFATLSVAVQAVRRVAES